MTKYERIKAELDAALQELARLKVSIAEQRRKRRERQIKYYARIPEKVKQWRKNAKANEDPERYKERRRINARRYYRKHPEKMRQKARRRVERKKAAKLQLSLYGLKYKLIETPVGI